VLNRFLEYVRLFYLSALRDSDIEFSPKSQFWGRILRDLKIGDEDRKKITEEMSKMNEALLKADPRLGSVGLSA
jgi:putative ATP-dependent endonuclease of OLD family